ncbi:UROD/MetE-like protein [Tuber magnatum]|uniref:UROD/MetE-like protein n=1 Tax=Tuber magnatum TaxID=42249 RepID=A0A317SN90_9PEZI|nr:UROD/MetE-like protein [Tuber magnatum]
MPIPVENVGSLPRPLALQKMLAAYDNGESTYEQLVGAQDEACKDSITRMEAVGQTCVTDGEQRVSSFATYPLVDTLGGSGLAENLAFDGQYFAIFEDGHHRQLPRLTGGPFKYKNYAADFLKLSKPFSKLPLKQAVIAPSMLYLLYPLDGSVEGYPREQFLNHLVNECEKDIRKCFEAGAVRVSIDFTEGRLALKNDPSNPWTGRGLLDTFVDLNNRVLGRFSSEERKNIGIHTCPGGDCDSVHSMDVDYTDLFPSLFKINAGYFLVQCASEPDKEKVYKLCGKYSRDDQVVFVGVINPLHPDLETAEEVCEALVAAAKHIPKHRLGATDDCGFSPFSTDVKPKHGGPDIARDLAFKKMRARCDGAKMASTKLGI